MSEKRTDNAEFDGTPVEIKFGSVVNLAGEDPQQTFLVLVPISTRKIEVTEIKNDVEGEELLGQLASTRSQPARVIGQWPYEKVERGWLRSYADDSGNVSPEMIAIAKKYLPEYSQRPPVMYTGKTIEEIIIETAEQGVVKTP